MSTHYTNCLHAPWSCNLSDPTAELCDPCDSYRISLRGTNAVIKVGPKTYEDLREEYFARLKVSLQEGLVDYSKAPYRGGGNKKRVRS